MSISAEVIHLRAAKVVHRRAAPQYHGGIPIQRSLSRRRRGGVKLRNLSKRLRHGLALFI
jgi:hypothetical protein